MKFAFVFVFLIVLKASFSVKFNKFHAGKMSKDLFYPFGLEHGDEKLPPNDDSFTRPIDISTTFPFFDKVYTSVFVNTNGIVSFESGISAFTPIPFPIDTVIGVAPFWTDIDIRYKGNVYYRETTDVQILSQITSELRRAFPQLLNYRPTWAFITTWDEVLQYPSTNTINTNTFQALIVTNGRHSFTIYNYGTMMWHGYAQAGFNAGDGITSYSINGSFTVNIVDIQFNSNVDIPGKWIFRIDQANITEGGCNSAGYMTVVPNNVFFIGGEDILVSGPCFKEDEEVEIIYDGQFTSNCSIIDSTSALCKVPFLNRVGRIPIEMKINANSTFTGYLLSKDLPLVTQIEGINNAYEENDLRPITINWRRINKFQNNDNDTFAVYYVHAASNKEMILLNDNLTNGLNTLDLSLITQHIDRKSVIGFIAAGRLNKIANLTQNIWFSITRIFILKENADETCKTWFKNDIMNKPQYAGLTPCWRTLPLLANGDFPSSFGEFVTDASCNPKNPALCNYFFNGAKGCYRSISHFNGIGQQCCYSSNNVLLVGPTGGGTLDAGHHNLYMNMHFTKDIIPYFLCCKFSNNCELYYKKRPSDDGANWIPPVPAGGTGDPHFLTLDNLSYTFNGYGEYVLLMIEEIQFEIQVRMSAFKDDLGKQKEGTVFKAIAINGGVNVSSIQIEINNLNNIDVYIGNAVYDFEDDSTSFELDGVLFSKSENNHVIVYENGIQVQVQLNNDKNAFLIFVSVPNKFKYKTKGLLGVMDGKIDNEFTLPNNTIVQLDPENDEEIFYKFGREWANNENTSIFTYMDGYGHSNYIDTSFVPKFMSAGIHFENSTLEILAKEQCGNNTKCLFDVSTTNSLSVGNMSVVFEEKIEQYQEFIEVAKVTCAPLSTTIENGDITSMIIENGIKYQIKCSTQYCIKGQSTIRCINAVYDYEVPECVICGASFLNCCQWLILAVVIQSLLKLF